MTQWMAAWRLLEGVGYQARSAPVRVPSSWRRDRDDDWFLRLRHPRSFDRGALDVIAVPTTLSPALVAADPTVTDLSGLWDAAVEVDLDGVPARTVSPTHHLFDALLGSAIDDVGGLERVADALVILDAAGDRIDWSDLVATAQHHQCDLLVADVLGHLRREWRAVVPTGIDAELRAPAPDRRQQAAAWFRRRAWAGPRSGPSPAAEFITRTRGLGPLGTIAHAPDFLVDRWHLDHRRHLPLVVAQRLRHRRRP